MTLPGLLRNFTVDHSRGSNSVIHYATPSLLKPAKFLGGYTLSEFSLQSSSHSVDVNSLGALVNDINLNVCMISFGTSMTFNPIENYSS